MFTIDNPEALIHVILFILALWIIAVSTVKKEED